MKIKLNRKNVPSVLKGFARGSIGDTIFYEYEDKYVIGQRIFKELIERFTLNGKDLEGKPRQGFYMSDEKKEIGILSQCQSLQAMLELANTYGLNFDDLYEVEGTQKSIRDLMDIVIKDLLENIIRKDGSIVFDASPYDKKSFTVENSYIDAITWVIPSFLLVLSYHAIQSEVCMWEDELVKVISYGIKYINSSYIDGGVGSNSLKIGWNFTKDCEEPSLYFTYAVVECLSTVFKTFETYLTYKNALRNERKYSGDYKVSNEILEAINALNETYERDKNKEKGLKNEKGKEIARFDEGNELIRVLRLIDPYIDNKAEEGSIYYELVDKCKGVAKEIWRLTQEGLAENFYCNDLHSTIKEEDIAMSTTNDALFNTAYIINILVNAGIDEDIKTEQEVALVRGQEDKSRLLELEYNDILESCQLAIQRTFRVYDNFKKNSKEYIVDQFLVGFNEKFEKHQALTKELRKLRIRIFSLTPILITTYNVISEYLIRYPQADMKKYLGYILENRYRSGRSIKWIWESDGFFSASNYYFILALGEFYSYYETYEKYYAKNYQDNQVEKLSIQQQFEQDFRRTTMQPEIAKRTAAFEEEIKKRDEEIKQLREQLANTPIEDAVRLTINKEMKKMFSELMCEFMKNAALAVGPDGSKQDLPEEYELFKSLFMQFIFSSMYNITKDDNLPDKVNKIYFEDFTDKLTRELTLVIKQISSQLLNRTDGTSVLSSLFINEEWKNKGDKK